MILGDDVFDIFCNMTVAPINNETCGDGGWTLVMNIDGNEVYELQTLPILSFKS